MEQKREIDVVNHITGADRLISRSIRHWNWNSTTKLNLNTYCRPSVQCVHVYFREPLVIGRIGEASPWEEYIRISPKFWHFNTNQHGGWRYKQSLMCHELGHILGLGHTNQGCMKEGTLDYRFPGAYNRSIVPDRLLNWWIE